MTSRIQQRRTTTVNGAPANNSLAPGELYVEEADPAKLWVGVATSVSASGVKKLVDAGTIGNALLKTGDTASGLMTFNGGINVTATPANVPLAAADTNTLQAASTSFVLGQAATTNPTQVGTAAPGSATRWSRGDHVHPATAPTPVPSDNSTAIATTAYVVAQFGAYNALVAIGDVPPTPVDRELWWNSAEGTLYVRYNDGNTTQWVAASPSAAGQYLLLSGGTVTGNLAVNGSLTLAGNAGSALQATPLQQVVPRIGRAAVYAGSIANPAGTTGNVMAGVGSLCIVTPQIAGNVHFNFQGAFTSATAGVICTAYVRFGIGTPPANGAGPAGTAVSSTGPAVGTISAINNYVPFTVSGLVTGLTLGTAYWFDIQFTPNTASCSLVNLTFTGVEL